MDPFKVPGPKRLPDKPLENLTIAAETGKLQKRDKSFLQKPYVAVEVDEAFQKQGLTLDVFAQKVADLLNNTVKVEEPIVTMLKDEFGDKMYEEIENEDGTMTRKPITTPLYILKPDGKAVKATRVVEKPDIASIKFVLELYKDIVIARSSKEGSAPEAQTETNMAMFLQIFMEQPEALAAMKKVIQSTSNIQDANFVEIA